MNLGRIQPRGGSSFPMKPSKVLIPAEHSSSPKHLKAAPVLESPLQLFSLEILGCADGKPAEIIIIHSFSSGNRCLWAWSCLELKWSSFYPKSLCTFFVPKLHLLPLVVALKQPELVHLMWNLWDSVLLTQKSVARWWLLSFRSRGQAQLWGGAGKALPLPGDVLCVLAHVADL